MSRTWQIQEAKNHFSKVVECAVKEGVQMVTKHGRPAVVVLSVEEYERVVGSGKSLFDALRSCPGDLTDLVGPRSKEPARTIRFDD
jgi:prevent-host-death family protein